MKTKFVYLLFIGLITLVHFSLYCVFRGGWGFPAAWLSARGGVGSASHWFLMFGNSILIGTVVSLACTIFVWYMKAHRYKFDVFISYRHDIGDDSGLGAACSLASKVETYLKVEQGLRVSLDSKTHLNDFQKNLPRRIKKSRSVLFLKTDHSLEPRWSDSGGAEQRDWVYEELCTALDNHIPLCVVWPNTSEEDKAYLPKELWYVPQDIPEGKRKLREYARKLKILKNYDVIEIAPGKQVLRYDGGSF